MALTEMVAMQLNDLLFQLDPQNRYHALRALITEAAEKAWGDTIFITWTVEDMVEACRAQGYTLPAEAALRALDYAGREHDAEHGITWDTLFIAAQETCSDEELQLFDWDLDTFEEEPSNA